MENQKEKLPAVIENFSLVDMTVSKKEVVNMLIEQHRLTIQEQIDSIEEKIEELCDFNSVLTETVKNKIVKEVKANPSIKGFLTFSNKVNSLCYSGANFKESVDVSATYRHDFGVNVDVRVVTKSASLFLGTSTERNFDRTIDLKKVSNSAKKLHTKLDGSSKKVVKLRKKLDSLRKEMKDFQKKSIKFQHSVVKAILAKSKEGRDLLKQVESISAKVM